MSKDKFIPEKERLKEILDNAWLNIDDVVLSVVKNPFDEQKSREDIENPHIYLIKLLRNPDNFFFTCKHIFNVELLPFQLCILKELWFRKYPMLIAARGAGKSFMLALYAMLRAFLHQGCKIVVVGAAFRQSKIIFEYCETIWNNAPILRDLVDSGGRSGPKRDIDRCTCMIGESSITAIPLGDGSKIRGQRANYIIADEFASISEEIYENVISGFAAVSSNPVEQVKNRARLAKLKEYGILKDDNVDDNLFMGNQAILSGTAYYDFNHFSKYWKMYKKIIESGGNTSKLMEIFQGNIPKNFNYKDYCVMRLPVELLPSGFMDEKHVARSKATVHSGIYNIEFGACFTTDSHGFYKRSLIESCVTKDGFLLADGQSIYFEAAIRGNPRAKYVFGIDPASEIDNFSITVLELHENHRRIVFCWTTTKNAHREKIDAGLVKEKDFYSYVARKIRDLIKIFPSRDIIMDSQGGGVAVAEALHDIDKLQPGELPIWPIIDDDNPQPTDDYHGLHILTLANFAKADWVREANHGLRKDFEDKVLLFPAFDALSLNFANEEDVRLGRLFDTKEDCVWEIEELKDELATIVHTQTGIANRDKWDTPEVKMPGSKKGRLRKDRYSALLMANMLARTLQRSPEPIDYQPVGGFTSKVGKFTGGKMYNAPAWFEEASTGLYGRSIRRS